MFEFRSFSSGSNGNAYLFRTDEGTFMIDAGLSTRRILAYLYDTGVQTSSLQALFVTHDHKDHAQCVGRLQIAVKRQGGCLPVYLTEGVLDGIDKNPVIRRSPDRENVRCITKGEKVECCGCEITPFNVPHDSVDNVGYFIRYGNSTLTLATDVGQITEELHYYINKTENLILEANYDEGMLMHGPYPAFLKSRIRGGNGHLSNRSAAELVFQHREHLRRVWFCHLSENNNTPQHVMQSLELRFQCEGLQPNDYFMAEPLPRVVPSKLFSI